MHTINCSTELLLADPAGCFSNLILPIPAADKASSTSWRKQILVATCNRFFSISTSEDQFGRKQNWIWTEFFCTWEIAVDWYLKKSGEDTWRRSIRQTLEDQAFSTALRALLPYPRAKSPETHKLLVRVSGEKPLKAYILCRRNTNFFFFFDSIVMEKRENWKTTKSLHAAFDAVVMVAKGTAENSRQLLLALLGGRLGRRLPLPHLTDRRRGAASEGVWRGGGSKNTQEC